MDGGDGVASTEGFVHDGFQRGRKGNRGKGRAVIEGPSKNTFQLRTQFDFLQSGAVIEGAIANFGNRVGQDHLRKLVAAVKGVVAHGNNSIGDIGAGFHYGRRDHEGSGNILADAAHVVADADRAGGVLGKVHLVTIDDGREFVAPTGMGVGTTEKEQEGGKPKPPMT